MPAKFSVLIADDHTLVRRGVRTLLSMQPDMEVIDDVATGEAAVALAAQAKPQVALVDLLMPGRLNGVMATREIKRVSPRTQVVILTSYHTDEHIFPALRAGALSYLLKDIDPETLVDVVRCAVRGEGVMSARIAQRLADSANELRPEQNDPLALLSPRELEVLRLIAMGRSNAEIAAELTLSENTIKGYVSLVLGKLQVTDRTKAAIVAWQAGLGGSNAGE
jgi:two-component system, NarL family, response regulator LiaR